ncbi:hypothetical protein ACFL15_00640 [Patescibacteria group bacterium]
MENIYEKEESFSFWKNSILVFAFFTLTPLVLLVSLFSLFSLTKYDHSEKGNVLGINVANPSGVKVFASLPTDLASINGYAIAQDAREEILKQYLDYYNSPLFPFAAKIVEEADKNELDFRLITAIAQKESNLCKIIPPQTYNCWGWGIHSKGTLGFSSYGEGIETVSKGIKENYIDKGFRTIEDIMSKYTPLSNGSWAEGVNQFISEME